MCFGVFFIRYYCYQPPGETFEFPALFEGKDEKEKKEKDKLMDELKESYKKFNDKTSINPGAPGWFSY